MNNTQRKEIAEHTVRIAEQGFYTSPAGHRVDLAGSIQSCLDGTRLYEPEELARLRQELPLPRTPAFATRFEVANETTLHGAARLLAQGGEVAALNFASARNPGGGFLRGTQAQEESLAYASALYRSLQRAPSYYQRHRNSGSLLYSHTMIVSPRCPVFRDDRNTLLEQPQLVSFLTSAAPNAGALRDQGDAAGLARLPEEFDRRVELLLTLAAARGCTRLVLGAWGCGVFRNDPFMVTQLFKRHLAGAFAGSFEHVLFSVLDRSGAGTFDAFSAAFQPEN